MRHRLPDGGTLRDAGAMRGVMRGRARRDALARGQPKRLI